MKRRDFVRTAIGAPLLTQLDNHLFVNYYEQEEDFQVADDPFLLHFMAIGDWGRNGEFLQQETAATMGKWASKNRTQFVISTGDNFYPLGVVSEQDPLWHFSFENIYTAYALQCDWYPVLGNHDYGADPDAQVRYSKISRRWKMPARYYSKEVRLGRDKGNALFIMLDTNAMVDDSRVEETKQQLEWMEQVLQNGRDARWKIVTGHHPAYTVGPRIEHRQVFEMRKWLTDVFQKHKVDVYLSGHEHSLQHLKPEGFTHQFVSGAGSQLTAVREGIEYSRFQASVNGFMYVSLNETKLNMKAIDYQGNLLYQTDITK